MRAWLFQDHRQKQKLGDRCPWSVGWIDPEGKRRSKRIGSKSLAEKFARKTEGQLAAGTYNTPQRATWDKFINEYESKTLAGMQPGTRDATQYALNHFERIIKPAKVASVTTGILADYVAKRRQESKAGPKRKRTEKLVSPATINKELRHLRAVFRKAAKWGFLAKPPEIEFLKEPGKLPVYVTPGHFALLYNAADQMRWPADLPYSAKDWWQGLLVMAYMTGWRIGSLLALRRSDVDLDAGTALSRAEFNKGRRDVIVPLHPLVVEHLRKRAAFDPMMFPWVYGRRALFVEMRALNKTAGIELTGERKYYAFHDLRRAFATMNADKLTPDVLQTLMQHKDYQTTQRYISMARQLNPAVANLYVPSLEKSTA